MRAPPPAARRFVRVSCALGVLLALACASACLSSSLVAREDRAVNSQLEPLDWSPATAGELPGLWRMHAIEGPAAAVLMDLSYWFDSEGRFSGAALFVGPPAGYQVLSGTWELEDGRIVLGEDAEPARVEHSAGGFLRLCGAEGSLVLERVEVE